MEPPDNAIIALHYNYTGKLHAGRYRGSLRPEAVAFLAVCGVIVLENLVVLVALWRDKKLHSPMYYLLGNLTLSDLGDWGGPGAVPVLVPVPMAP
uniref:G-protein coupled receptors family 1 profile domain-containing protein n=1 Tax=Cairina moschata TaxID=8855 RepID=A0A8C3CI81_CAIMO